MKENIKVENKKSYIVREDIILLHVADNNNLAKQKVTKLEQNRSMKKTKMMRPRKERVYCCEIKK